jgi:hypothetical protein
MYRHANIAACVIWAYRHFRYGVGLGAARSEMDWGWLFVALAIIVFAIQIRYEDGHLEVGWTRLDRVVRVSIAASTALSILLLGALAWYFWSSKNNGDPDAQVAAKERVVMTPAANAPPGSKAPAPISSTEPAQSSQSENTRREAILARLSDEYRKTEAACANPLDQWYANKWANRRLKEMGESWQLPVPTIEVQRSSNNSFFGPCNSLDVQAHDAEVSGNHLFGPRNKINVDSDKAKVNNNSMDSGRGQ